MKILIVHNRYQTKNVGGEDIVYLNELEGLKDKLGAENIFFYEISNDQISKIRLVFSIWFSREHYRTVYNIVKENAISIVHVHNFFPLLTPSVFKAARDAGAKVVHTLHNYRWWCIAGTFYRSGYGVCEACLSKRSFLSGILYRCYRGRLFQSILAQTAFWFYKMCNMFRWVDIFFVLTDFQREKIIGIGVDPKKVLIKPNSMIRHEGCFGKKYEYVYVGRLEEAKGINVLLATWAELSEEYNLTVIGAGEFDDQLKSQYSNKNITFVGKKLRDETLEIISQSKYLIQPSLLFETFGLTIIEAMSFGVPVIGFDIGTRPNFIKHLENGFLCRPETLKNTIVLSNNYREYELLSENAMKTSEHFRNETIVKRQIELYNQLIAE